MELNSIFRRLTVIAKGPWDINSKIVYSAGKYKQIQKHG